MSSISNKNQLKMIWLLISRSIWTFLSLSVAREAAQLHYRLNISVELFAIQHTVHSGQTSLLVLCKRCDGCLGHICSASTSHINMVLWFIMMLRCSKTEIKKVAIFRWMIIFNVICIFLWIMWLRRDMCLWLLYLGLWSWT